MWSRFRTPGMLLALLATASCGIPPYSSVRDVDVRGLYTLKVRGLVHEDVDLIETNRDGSGGEVKEPLDRMSSYGIEIERNMGDQWTASFAVQSRQYEPEGVYPNIRSNQLRASFRRYFGDRALTAFIAADVIYGLGLDFQDDSGESENWLGWGLGTGLNLAISEHFSIEGFLMYEGMPAAEFQTDAGAPVKNYTLSGPVAYVGFGWHF